MILMLDNYDSFTYNVVQYLGELDQEVQVFRNDEITTTEARELEPSHIVISPGPCTPNEAGISVELVQEFAGEIPILGICLGHQSIAQAFGGRVVRARQVMHGKMSAIYHNGEGLFQDLDDGFQATRYHSLIVERASLPDCFSETAWTLGVGGTKDEIMGMRHNEMAVYGVQFHPESFMTNFGHRLFSNFVDQN